MRYWTDILAKGIKPSDVMLLGIGGGPLSHVEYCVALGLGASVGIVMNTGGTADQLLKDDLWSDLPNLYPLPFDATTVRAFVIPPRREFDRRSRREDGQELPQGLRFRQHETPASQHAALGRISTTPSKPPARNRPSTP